MCSPGIMAYHWLCVTLHRLGRDDHLAEHRIPSSDSNLAYCCHYMQDMRVLGLSTRTFERPPKDLSREDETEMTFCGFLAFLDPPKDCAIPCIKELYGRAVAVKV